MKQTTMAALVLTCVVAMTSGLRADDGAILVHFNQDFVAAGQTFPAGSYSFASDLPSSFVTIRQVEGGSRAFLLPMTFEGGVPGQVHVTLQRIDGVNYLTEIATPLGVYTLTPPRALTKLAKAKADEAMSSSGTN